MAGALNRGLDWLDLGREGDRSRNLEAIFHGDVTGGEVNKEFRNEVGGDFLWALRRVRGFAYRRNK